MDNICKTANYLDKNANEINELLLADDQVLKTYINVQGYFAYIHCRGFCGAAQTPGDCNTYLL